MIQAYTNAAENTPICDVLSDNKYKSYRCAETIANPG